MVTPPVIVILMGDQDLGSRFLFGCRCPMLIFQLGMCRIMVCQNRPLSSNEISEN